MKRIQPIKKVKYMKRISVVGARPNFMKIAPFIKAIEEYNVSLQKSEVGGQETGRRGRWLTGRKQDRISV